MRHRRRVSRSLFQYPTTTIYLCDGNDDEDGKDDSSRSYPRVLSIARRPYLPPRSSIFSYILFIVPSILLCFARNREDSACATRARISLRARANSNPRSRSIVVGRAKVTCDKLAFLIRIFEESINVTSIREFMKDSQSRYSRGPPRPIWLRTFAKARSHNFVNFVDEPARNHKPRSGRNGDYANSRVARIVRNIRVHGQLLLDVNRRIHV